MELWASVVCCSASAKGIKASRSSLRQLEFSAGSPHCCYDFHLNLNFNFILLHLPRLSVFFQNSSFSCISFSLFSVCLLVCVSYPSLIHLLDLFSPQGNSIRRVSPKAPVPQTSDLCDSSSFVSRTARTRVFVCSPTPLRHSSSDPSCYIRPISVTLPDSRWISSSFLESYLDPLPLSPSSLTPGSNSFRVLNFL